MIRWSTICLPIIEMLIRFSELRNISAHDGVWKCCVSLKIKKLPRDQIKIKVTESLNMVSMVGYENRYSQQLSGANDSGSPWPCAYSEPKSPFIGWASRRTGFATAAANAGCFEKIAARVGYHIYLCYARSGWSLTMSDKIAVMYQGKVQQVGTARRFMKCPKIVLSRNSSVEQIF